MKSILKFVEKLDKIGSKAGLVSAFMGSFGSGWLLVHMIGKSEEEFRALFDLIRQLLNLIGKWWLILPFVLVAGYNHVMYNSLVRVAVRTAYVLPVVLSCMYGVAWLAKENTRVWIPVFALLASLWVVSKLSKFMIKLGGKYFGEEHHE